MMFNTLQHGDFSEIYCTFPCGHKTVMDTSNYSNDGYRLYYTTPPECPECKRLSAPQYNSTIGSRYF